MWKESQYDSTVSQTPFLLIKIAMTRPELMLTKTQFYVTTSNNVYKWLF